VEDEHAQVSSLVAPTVRDKKRAMCEKYNINISDDIVSGIYIDFYVPVHLQ